MNRRQQGGVLWILLLAVVVALASALVLAHQNRALSRRIATQDSNLSGPAKAIVGDFVPRFLPAGEEQACRLFYIFSPRCPVCEVQDREWLPKLLAEARHTSTEVLRVSLDDAPSREATRSGSPAGTGLIYGFPSRAIQRAYRVTAIPEVLLVTPADRVFWVHYGLFADEAFDSLKDALAACSLDRSDSLPSKPERSGSHSLSEPLGHP